MRTRSVQTPLVDSVPVNVVRLDAPIGVEVRGIDLGQPMDEVTFAAIDR
jgi:alpha-ketoglutarate-dependent taurine dioxygenase